MTRVLVVYCHPDHESFIAAARDRALAGLARGGHDVRLTDLYADGFEPAMTAEERRTHAEPGIDPSRQRYADDLMWAEALVLVYPTWYSGQPAMLKGWIDRIWVAGVAWHLPPGKTTIRGLLTRIRRIVIVTAHGSPKYINALEGEWGKRTVTRTLRVLCSRRTRTTWCAVYGIDGSDEAKRLRFLDRVERTMSRL